MKKVICIIIILAMVFSMYSTGYAILYLNNKITCIPALSYSGSTAKCELSVSTTNPSDKIVATIKLKNSNGITVKSWSNVTAYGSLSFNDKYSVVSGKTYTLYVEVKVTGSNGTDNINKSVSKACP